MTTMRDCNGKLTDMAVRILLIDDEYDEYVLMGQLLTAIGHTRYELTWCRQANHAMEAIQSELHDVILLDYKNNLGESQGLLTKAVNQGCQTPIIVMTDKMDRHLDKEAIKSGAADYLVKGYIDSQILERSLRYAMDRKEAEQKLAKLAHYDVLTNVPNRILFRDRLQRAIERAKRGHQNVALLFLDLDGFKQVNDTLGHDAGDALICAVAERLTACVRKSDSVARIGGDEFTLILEDIETTADIVNVAKKVIDIISRPIAISGQQIFIGCSIGIAAYPEGGEDVDSLLKHADMAMYQAKSLRGSTYRFYTEKMNVEAMNQMYLEADLRRGLRRNEFELYYQPRINLATGKVVGMEGLIRWNHPVRGIISPAEFVPLAEEVGLIVPMGYWVVHQACQDINRMAAMGLEPLQVAVNLSFKQFQDEKFVDTITNIVRSSQIDGSRLEFELTETAIMSNFEETDRCMRQLAGLGVSFSLDDFGTGYSSFVHLQRLPISALKVDRSFIKNVTSKEDDATIVKAMINLAHSLELEVVAEGAETREQVAFLRQNNADQVQGFYFSAPIAFNEFCQLLEQEIALAL